MDRELERDGQERLLVAVGAALAGVAVALGAIGAHVLKGRIGGEAIGWWGTATEFQMWHALAVLSLGLAGPRWTRIPAWLLAGGVLLFSSTLYAMALGAPHWLGAVTPVGGFVMIGGWTVLGWRAMRDPVLSGRE